MIPDERPVEFLTAAEAERLFGPWRRRLAESERDREQLAVENGELLARCLAVNEVRRQLAEALREVVEAWDQGNAPFVGTLRHALAASDALDRENQS